MEFPVSWVFDRFWAWVFEKSLSFKKNLEFFAKKGQFLTKIWVFDVNLHKNIQFLEFMGQKSLSFWEIFLEFEYFRPWVFGQTPKKPVLSPASSMFWYWARGPVDEASPQTSLGRFMLSNVQDLFGRDASSTGPRAQYQNIDESSALRTSRFMSCTGKIEINVEISGSGCTYTYALAGIW